VDLQANLVTIEPVTDRTLELAAVPRAIRESGFRPGSMRLRARGTLAEGGRAFRIAGWPEPLPIQGPAPASPGPLTIEALVEAHDGAVVLRLLRPPAR
jgi:hypothetical protein